jgi:hypothetical protein
VSRCAFNLHFQIFVDVSSQTAQDDSERKPLKRFWLDTILLFAGVRACASSQVAHQHYPITNLGKNVSQCVDSEFILILPYPWTPMPAVGRHDYSYGHVYVTGLGSIVVNGI